jgi:hypothetical protein
MSRRTAIAALLLAGLLAGCGGSTSLLQSQTTPASQPPAVSSSPSGASRSGSGQAPSVPGPSARGAASAGRLGFPYLATNNTTRIASDDPASIAAAAALAAFPSAIAGTHPSAVTLAPSDDWQAALAAASLMGAPFRAPLLIAGNGSLPPATANALSLLAPTGNRALGGAQVIEVGDTPAPDRLKSTAITGSDPYALAAAIDRFEARRRGAASINVVIASAQYPAYAMPAAGWAAESGEPILYVNNAGVPAATQRALLAHRHAHLYVLGPASAIPDSVLKELAAYGTVKRIAGDTPAATSVAFAAYRDPACAPHQPCAHVPGSFGWAIESPGHGFVMINQRDPLAAAAASVLSATGTYGPQLLIADPNTLPRAVLNYFVNYATPGIGKEGPTAAFYNHAWLIGTSATLTPALQAQLDSLLAPVPVKQ